MSVRQRVKAIFAEPDEELAVLTENEDDAQVHDLGGEYRLEVLGQPHEDNRPLQFRIYDESGRRDTMFTVFEPPVGVFDPNADVLDRYARVVEGLVHEEGADTFREVVADLAEQRRNGQLLVVDDKIATLIQSTQKVEFDESDRNQPWTVYFVDDYVDKDFGMDRVRFKAEDWASDSPTERVPTGGYTPSDERWRQLRHIWTLMYARDAGVDMEDTEGNAE